MQYKLDLAASNNVNIDCEGLLIDAEVPAGEMKVAFINWGWISKLWKEFI